MAGGGFRVTQDGSLRVTQALEPRITQEMNPLYAVVTINSVGIVVNSINKIVYATAPLASIGSELSVSTYTASMVMIGNSTGTIVSNGVRIQNFTANLSSTGTTVASMGFLRIGSASLSSLGTLVSPLSLYYTVSSPLTSAGAIINSAMKILNAVVSISSAASVSSIPSLTQAVTLSLPSVSSQVSLGSFIAGAKTQLSAQGAFTIYPLLIEAAAALINGSSSCYALATNLPMNIFAYISSTTSILNGDLMTVLSAVHGGTVNRRVTQDGLNVRVTNLGGVRVLSEQIGIATSEIVVDATLIPFNGSISGKAMDSTWGTVTPYVKNSGGSWVIPKVYVNDNNTWKRVA
jgi:hypothetical protein